MIKERLEKEGYIVGRDNIGRVNRGKVVGEIAKRRGVGGTTPM